MSTLRRLVCRTMLVMVLFLAMGLVNGCRESSGVRGDLVVYTSVPNDLIQAVGMDFMDQYPDINLVIYREGTGGLMSRLRQELAAGQTRADVIWPADFTVGEALKTRGDLLKYKSPEAEKVVPLLKDPDDYYCAARLLNMILAYNPDQLNIRPKKYADLLLPQYRGRVGLADPAYSGASLYTVATLVQDREYGWGFFERLHQNGCRLYQGNGALIEALVSGEVAVGLTIDFMVREKKLKDPALPLGYVFPENGGVTAPSPVAIIKGSPHLPAAKAFVDFVLSREGQALLAREGVVPVRLDVRPPDGIPTVTQMKIIPSSLERIREEKAQILETFQKLFAGEEAPGTRNNVITLYTSVPEPIMEQIRIDFETRHPGIYLDIFREGTPPIMKKVAGELAGGNVKADLLWVADFTVAEDLKEQNVFLRYVPPEAAQLLTTLKDPDGAYYAARLLNLVVAYRKEAVSRTPSRYWDLTEPEYHGRIGHGSPELSGAFLYFMGTLLPNPDYGEIFFRNLAANAPVILTNSEIVEKIAAGELDMGLTIDYLVRAYLKSNPEAPIDYVYPVSGVVMAPSPIGIFKGGPQTELAKKFESYILSRPGQERLRDLAGVVPVRLDVRPPGRIGSITQLQVIRSDEGWIRRHRDDIKRQFREIYAPVLEGEGGLP